MSRVLFPEGVNDIADKMKMRERVDKALFRNKCTDFISSMKVLIRQRDRKDLFKLEYMDSATLAADQVPVLMLINQPVRLQLIVAYSLNEQVDRPVVMNGFYKPHKAV